LKSTKVSQIDSFWSLANKIFQVHSEKVQKVLVKVAEAGVETAIAATCTMS
jgi:phosphoribosyl-ATP pyrophosphohydrolase